MAKLLCFEAICVILIVILSPAKLVFNKLLNQLAKFLWDFSQKMFQEIINIRIVCFSLSYFQIICKVETYRDILWIWADSIDLLDILRTILIKSRG